MKYLFIILLLTLPPAQGTVTEALQFLYNAVDVSDHFMSRDNAIVGRDGLSSDSAVKHCLFKETKEGGFTILKSVCNKAHNKKHIHDAFVHSRNRPLVYMDCGMDRKDGATLDIKNNNNFCYCKTLQLGSNKGSNSINIQSTSYNPGCSDEQINLPDYLLRGQEHLAALVLSNIPNLLIQPGAFDNLQSLEFVLLANDGLSTGDLPPGLFCNNIKLKKLHLQGLNFTTFPSQLFNCNQTMDEAQCLPLLIDVFIQHTSIEAIPSSPFGCVRGIAKLFLTNNHISSLKPNIFQHLSNLTELQLSSNRFTRIEAVWFAGANSLNVLYLHDNQISHIDGSFAQLCLRGIHMRQNILQSISANVFNTDCLISLDVSLNQLATFEVGSLSDLNIIIGLNISANKITSMTTVTKSFINSGKYLRWLLVNDNSITELKEFDFQPFKILKYLVLNNNYIEKIHPLAFSNMHRLKELYLENNLLTYIESHFSALSNLNYLFLGGNKIRKINAGMFHGLHRLNKLGMNNNLIDLIDKNSFKDLRFIMTLNLNNNNLTYINDNVIPASVRHLNLSNNLLENIPCSTYIHFLKILFLNYNRISHIKRQPRCFMAKLETLYINYNFIKTIDTGAFKRFSVLRTLQLTGNSLRLNFTFDHFVGAPLLDLNLAFNKIDSLENLFLHESMNSLKRLELSRNPIFHVPKQPFLSILYRPLVVNVRSLWLHSCNITSIDPQAFVNLKSVEHINLMKNQITYFPNLQLPKGRSPVIDMLNNDIECSCRMKWLRMNESLWHMYNFKYCYYRGNDSYAAFKQLPADLFVCETDIQCDTTMCSCFAKNQDSGPAIIDCSDRNSSSLPELFAKMAGVIHLHKNNYKYLALSHNSSVAYSARVLTLYHCNIEQITATSFTNFKYLEELYLNDNRINLLQHGIFAGLTLLKLLTLNGNLLVEISGDILSSNKALKVLHLHNNSLKRLTTQTRQVIKDLSYLTTFSLYDNPWICECDNNSWKIWLRDLQPKLTKSWAIECDNGTSILKKPDDFFLCPNDTVVQTVNVIQNVRGYALAVSLPVVLLLTVIIVMALSFYHRQLLAVFMFSYWGIRFSKDTSSDEFTFDAILLYDEDPQSNQDFSSNDTIIDVIYTWMTSVDPPYKVMLPIVDIAGGTNWAEEIARGISNSKKKVFYITKEFLEKQQTMNVFGIAYSTSMERKSTDLILIIDNKQTLRYIRSSHDEDPRLKALLWANKYILYHDKHFFKKLMYLLPGKKRTINYTATNEHMLEEL